MVLPPLMGGIATMSAFAIAIGRVGRPGGRPRMIFTNRATSPSPLGRLVQVVSAAVCRRLSFYELLMSGYCVDGLKTLCQPDLIFFFSGPELIAAVL